MHQIRGYDPDVMEEFVIDPELAQQWRQHTHNAVTNIGHSLHVCK